MKSELILLMEIMFQIKNAVRANILTAQEGALVYSGHGSVPSLLLFAQYLVRVEFDINLFIMT